MNKKGIIRNDGSPSRLKFHGFGFYIRSRGNLLKKDREKLLNESRNCLAEVNDLTGESFELDPSWSDQELLEQWNEWYRDYGHLMSRFKDKWEDDILKEKLNEVPKSVMGYIRDLEEKVEGLESRLNRLEIERNMKGIRQFGLG
ncbi:hypothetical protein [[Muricauda] lutisoli]|uniref:Uncharacterized protein n=1 Tax=[Muricauda] lutisoli TaxID=2816035 RepID=A0ABS3EU32_9FLAO|nr:hypothetical protein [[Muricauda] lutisoli]MBO0329761.1 hypothetical protein [[Muricauda] lutisoli]